MSNVPRKNSTQLHFHVRIFRRPWYDWAIWTLWFLFEIFIAQSVVASYQEYEFRAATVFGITFGVFLFLGIISFFLRTIQLKSRLHEQAEEDEENILL